METRANYVIVGIFTLAAILAAFAFVYWTAQIGDKGETTLLRVRIQGSASGLGPGSLVLFNGVKVGVVKRVYFDPKDPNAAIANTEIDKTTPITKSTQADIGIASLAGQVNIELKGADPKEPRLLEQAEKEGRTAEIVANPSAVNNLLQTAQNIFTRADKVLSDLEGFTKDVRGPLTQTVKNAQTFSDALAKNADGIDKFLSSVSALADELKMVILAPESRERTWDAIRGFIAVHYKFNTQLHTPFWRECRAKTDLACAADLVDFYMENGPTPVWQRAIVDPYDQFRLSGYWTLMVGMGVPYRTNYVPSPAHVQLLNNKRAFFRQRALAAMSVREGLDLVHSPQWQWG